MKIRSGGQDFQKIALNRGLDALDAHQSRSKVSKWLDHTDILKTNSRQQNATQELSR